MRDEILSSIVAASVVAGALTSGPAEAGLGEWTSLGPFGGSVASLAIDPQTPTTLYAGTSGGVFKSVDGGVIWSAASDGLADLSVGELAIDPQTPTTLYAGTEAGVFKSLDGGAHWSAANDSLPEYVTAIVAAVYTLAIDPQTPTTLYAGTSTGGVYKSTDGGGHWTAATGVLPELNATADGAPPATGCPKSPQPGPGQAGTSRLW